MAELQAWLRAAPELPQIRHPFLIQLAWADLLPGGELDSRLAKYEEDVRDQLALLRAGQRRGDALPGTARAEYIDPAQARTARETILWHLIQENWIGFYEHEYNWVRRLRQELAGRGANS